MPPTAAIAIQATVDREDLLAWWQGALGELHAVLGAQGLRPYGGPAAVMSKVGRHPPRRLRGLNARVEFHGLDAAPPTIYERSA